MDVFFWGRNASSHVAVARLRCLCRRWRYRREKSSSLFIIVFIVSSSSHALRRRRRRRRWERTNIWNWCCWCHVLIRRGYYYTANNNWLVKWMNEWMDEYYSRTIFLSQTRTNARSFYLSRSIIMTSLRYMSFYISSMSLGIGIGDLAKIFLLLLLLYYLFTYAYLLFRNWSWVSSSLSYASSSS